MTAADHRAARRVLRLRRPGRSSSRVDLTVTAGEVVAVLGPNGSGKSTLVRGLLGLNDQLGGEVRLFGAAARLLPRLRPARLRPPATHPLGVGAGHRRARSSRSGACRTTAGGGRSSRSARTPPSSTRRLDVVGLADRAARRRLDPLRRPAAPGAHRPGARRPARRPPHGRAHRRRRRRQPARARRRPGAPRRRGTHDGHRHARARRPSSGIVHAASSSSTGRTRSPSTATPHEFAVARGRASHHDHQPPPRRRARPRAPRRPAPRRPDRSTRGGSRR